MREAADAHGGMALAKLGQPKLWLLDGYHHCVKSRSETYRDAHHCSALVCHQGQDAQVPLGIG